MTKVVCLGGSIAGLHVAKFLLSSGLDVDVEVLERKPKIGYRIVCAGGISSFMIRKLKLYIPNEFVASKVKRVRFYGPTFDFAELNFEKEYGLVLWRARWESWLGEQVRELGGRIYTGVRNPYERLKEADVIVGTDGIAGISRRLVGKPFPEEDVHIAVQAVGKARVADEEAISLYFGRQTAPEGYAWTFPLPGSQFRIGLGVPLRYSSKLFSFFKKFLVNIDGEIKGKPGAKLIPTAYPEKTLVSTFMGTPIAFVGDAGLQTDPSTGGGIGPAILGAKCLAEALSRGELKHYDRLWRKELYRRNRQRYKLKQVLCEMNDGDWELIIEELRDFEPFTESIGWALLQLILKVAFSNPSFLVRHKLLRRILF